MTILEVKLVKKFCERYILNTHNGIEKSPVAASIFKDKQYLYFVDSYPYRIEKYTFDGGHIKTLTREVDFYKEPTWIKKEYGYYDFPTGAYSAALLNNGKMIALLLYSNNKEKREYRNYIDLWDNSTYEYLGIHEIKWLYNLGDEICGLNNSIFYSTDNPFSHVAEYETNIKIEN